MTEPVKWQSEYGALVSALRESNPEIFDDECSHCGGAGRCACLRCTFQLALGPAPCCMCAPLKNDEWLLWKVPARLWIESTN